MKFKKEFYLLPAVELAKKLLGQYLCVETNGKKIKYLITETEAYFGETDTACHAKNGKTKRNAVMYEEGGVAYCYLCYGIHCLLNIISGEKDHPEAVLIRGVKGLNGPGKLTKGMNIDMSFNGESLLNNKIYIEKGLTNTNYISAKRVGIDYATDYYKNIEWRFILKED